MNRREAMRGRDPPGPPMTTRRANQAASLAGIRTTRLTHDTVVKAAIRTTTRRTARDHRAATTTVITTTAGGSTARTAATAAATAAAAPRIANTRKIPPH